MGSRQSVSKVEIIDYSVDSGLLHWAQNADLYGICLNGVISADLIVDSFEFCMREGYLKT
jgi:hypothetical protein